MTGPWETTKKATWLRTPARRLHARLKNNPRPEEGKERHTFFFVPNGSPCSPSFEQPAQRLSQSYTSLFCCSDCLASVQNRASHQTGWETTNLHGAPQCPAAGCARRSFASRSAQTMAQFAQTSKKTTNPVLSLHPRNDHSVASRRSRLPRRCRARRNFNDRARGVTQ